MRASLRQDGAMTTLFDAPSHWTSHNDRITARFATKDFATGLKFVNLIGASAEDANHHPDIELTYSLTTVTLTSHDVGAVTERDISLARIIDEHAKALGITPKE